MSTETPRAVTVWWGIPCKSAIPMVQALAEQTGRDVRFVALRDLPKRRKDLGWSLPAYGELSLEILTDDTWQARADELLAARDGLHIVNGIYHDARIRHVVRRLVATSRDFGIAMEAPANLETGWRRWAKALLAPVVNPLRTWGVARRAEFVLSASGERYADFRRLGFRAGRIFPFGYFPERAASTAPRESASPELRLLCIGYLEPFKGQDVLLRAVALLRRQGVDARAVVTGFGSFEASLRRLTKRLGLDEAVEFAGVVSDARLAELFATSSVLVAPGREEPWGIRVNEALLAGLPVVVSDRVGAKELIENSGAGEIFRAGSARSLAAALERAHARLQGAGELLQTVRAFRPAITPQAAGTFMEQVIAYTETLPAASGPMPVPAWRRPAGVAGP